MPTIELLQQSRQSPLEDVTISRHNNIYLPEDAELLSFPHTQVIRRIVHDKIEECLHKTKKSSNIRDRFYEKLTAITAEQKAVSKVALLIKEKAPLAVLCSNDNPFIKKSALDQPLDTVVRECLNRQRSDFFEIKNIIKTIFNNQETLSKLVSGGQQIIDLAAGRGELGLSLLFEVYLKQLEKLGLPINTDLLEVEKHFSKHGILPNKLTLLEPYDYSADTHEIITVTPYQLKNAICINQCETSDSLIHDYSFPEDSIVVGHRLCGSLIDDAINAFSDSKASILTALPCCFYKAEGEAPRYGLSQEAWDKTCADTDIRIFSHGALYLIQESSFISAIKSINQTRVNALNAIPNTTAICSYISSLGIIFAVRNP